MSLQDLDCATTWCDGAFLCWGNTCTRMCCFPVPTPQACKHSQPSTCFPSAAKVTLENRKLVTMSELKPGDKVKTGKMKKMKIDN